MSFPSLSLRFINAPLSLSIDGGVDPSHSTRLRDCRLYFQNQRTQQRKGVLRLGVCSSSVKNIEVEEGKKQRTVSGTAGRNGIGSLSQGYGVVGFQWGDEGKGKLVDRLGKRFDIVSPCQAAEQTQTITRESSTITVAPIREEIKSPELDDGGSGLPPRDDGDGGGGGGGGGGHWTGGFFFFGFLALLGFLKDKESEGDYDDKRRKRKNYN